MRIIHSTLAILAIWCATGSLAWSVSVYDVIELSRKGYSDEEIVNIIRTTRSVFKMTAEDIPRLKNLGVNEAVIRTMLTSVPAELAGTKSIASGTLDPKLSSRVDSAIADRASDERVEKGVAATSESHSHADSDTHGPTAITPDWFAIKAVSEEAAGDHQHAYVTLSTVPILILRDDGRFQSIEARGSAVINNLEEVLRMGDGRFKMLHTDGAESVVYQSADLRELFIIAVSRHDVKAYNMRSERHVTADLLASYWAALLNDFWAITFRRRAPSRLVDLHRGDALMLLYEVVNRTLPDEPMNLGAAVQQLPGMIQTHLEKLAATVPDDFDTWPEYAGEAS